MRCLRSYALHRQLHGLRVRTLSSLALLPSPLVLGPNQFIRDGNRGRTFNEPELVVRLLELYPVDKTWIPVGKWMHDIPDEVKEALVPYGGLTQFAGTQSNFFIVRKENGVNVVSLSTMGLQLCREKARQDRQNQKQTEKLKQRFSTDSRLSSTRGSGQRSRS